MEQFKLSFDYAKQVVTTGAVVITLILAVIKNATAIDGWVLSILKCASVSLLVSTVLGIVCLGRHVGLAGEANPSDRDPIIRGLAIGQHSTFLLGLAGLVIAIVST